MAIDKARVAMRFNRSAATYDTCAQVQQEMAVRLVSGLAVETAPVRRVLEIGCGTGHLTRLLLRRFPGTEIVAVDLAENMVKTAREQLRDAPVRFLVGDAEELDFSSFGPFDLIISGATIQWLTRPETSIPRWAESLRPGGRLAASTFGPDTFRELRETFSRVEAERGLPPACRVLPLRTAEEWTEIWQKAGLGDIRAEERRLRAEYPSCRAFLESVKRTGASLGAPDSRAGADLRVLPEVFRRYDREFRSAGGVYTTWHLLEISGKRDGS